MTPTHGIQGVNDTQGRPAWLGSGPERGPGPAGQPTAEPLAPQPGHPVRLTQPGPSGGPIPDPEGELADLHRMRKLLTPPLSARPRARGGLQSLW
jgi:hypothetical protein